MYRIYVHNFRVSHPTKKVCDEGSLQRSMKQIRTNARMRTNNLWIIFVELGIYRQQKFLKGSMNAYQVLHACCAGLVDTFQVLQNKMCITIDDGDANIIVVLILPRFIDIRFTVTDRDVNELTEYEFSRIREEPVARMLGE